MQARKVDYNCRLRWNDTCYECDWRKARTLKDTRRFMCQGWKAECLLMSQKYPLGTRENNFLKFPNAFRDAIGEFKPRSCGMWDNFCRVVPRTSLSTRSIAGIKERFERNPLQVYKEIPFKCSTCKTSAGVNLQGKSF